MAVDTIDLQGKTSFPERLKKILGDQSARAFARASGIDDKSIRKYLAGSAEPTLKNLLKIADAGGVSVQWLATGDSKPASEYTEDKKVQKIVELLSDLPDQDRKEILSRAESLHRFNQQSEELAALKDIVEKIANGS